MERERPKYLMVRDAVYQEAVRGASSQLPSEREICQRYAVSRITARKALDSLAEEGLALREVGRGTFLTGGRGRTALTVYICNAPDEFGRFFAKEAELFCQSHPGVCIKVEVTQALQAVKQTMQAGGGVLGTSHFGYLRNMGVLEPLEQREGFPEAVSTIYGNWTEWSPGAHGRKHCFSLPLMVAPEVFAFNRTYAAELGLSPRGPGSWQEVLDWGRAARTLASRQIIPTTMTRRGQLPLSYYLSASGGRYMLGADADDLEFSFEAGEEWLEFFRTLVREVRPQIVQGRERAPQVRERSSLVRGRSLFAYEAGPWVMLQSQLEQTQEQMGVCGIPPVRAGQPYFASVSKWGLGLLRGADEAVARAGWAFIAHCCATVAAQSRLLEHFSCFSVNRELFLRQQADPVWFPYAQALTGGRLRNDHPLQHLIMGYLREEFDAVLFRDRPVREAAQAVRQFARGLLDVYAAEPERYSGLV